MTSEHRIIIRLGIAIGATLLLAAPAARAGVVDPDLQAALGGLGPADRVSVIVRFAAHADLGRFQGQAKHLQRTGIVAALKAQSGASLGPVEPILSDPSVSRRADLWAINGVALSAGAGVIEALAGRAEVARISTDAVIEGPGPAKAEPASAEWNLNAIHAFELWNAGFTGAGVVVGSMDTGVDASHPDLAAGYRGGVNSWFDPYGEHPAPYDRSGHGTQSMGVMVGGGAGGTAIGVAPDARWIAAKIFDDSGNATLSAIHLGFQWMLDPDGDPQIDDAADVVNNSWSLGNVGDCVLEFETDIEILKAARIAVVFAGGNNGPTAGSCVSPANNPSGFAVGFVDQSDRIADSSGRGPSACDGTVYPEVVAPGVGVRTADLGSLYAWVSGTSVSAPHASGAMALLLSAHSGATPEQLERALAYGAFDLGEGGPDSSYGHGRIDVAIAEALLAKLVAGVGAATVYTDEAEFLAAVSGLETVAEGFEDDGTWGAARSPDVLPSVTSQGITWTSNHAANNISTSGGAARSGNWGLFSDPHGDQTVSNPADFITDGVIGTSGPPLAAVGGWFRGSPGGEVKFVLDGDGANPIALGPVDGVHRFYGVVVDGSFSSYEFRETEGTLEDQKLIFVDDVTVALLGGGANHPPDGVIVLPTSDLTVAPGEPVFFEGSASDPDGDAVTVLWDFGDGRSSTELAPGDLVYQQPGTYTVTLTATDSHGLADPTPARRTITVAAAMTGVVAGVANVTGAQGADWHSDLFVHNAGVADAMVELYYSPADGTVGAPETVTVVPDQTLALEDVVASVFGVSGSGAVFWRVVGGDPDRLLVNANTYNRVDPVQRYGQQIPGVRWSDAAHAATHVQVPALAGRYRTNLGFATGADCTVVAVTGFDRGGALVAQRTLAVQPWSWVQLNSLFEHVFPDLLPDPASTPVADSLHRFQINGVDGNVVGYTSIIDNDTNDGSYMLGQVAGGGDGQWLPGAAVISGENDSRWRSDVVAMNPSGGAITTEVAFYPSGQDNGGPLDVEPVPLAAGESAFEGNILVELFGYAPPMVGSLEVAADAGVAPLLWMRTYTEEPAPGGGTVTYGQTILPRAAAATVAPGTEGRIAGFSHDDGTRANLILQNTRVAGDGSRLPATVSVELLASDGALLHQQTYSLLPGEYRQHNRFPDDYGVGGPVTHASLRVTELDEPGAGESGGVDAMVSEVNGNIDAGTNDGRLLRAEVVPSDTAPVRARRLERAMDNQASRPTGPSARRVGASPAILIALTLLATPAAAQVLVATDDAYGVGYGAPLAVETPGVLDNDTYNGGPAADAGATVALIGGPSFGTLECDSDPVAYDVCPDGSFTYTPGAGFWGLDSFTYEAAVDGTTDQATVFLSACTGGATQFVCWQEAAYLAKVGELGYSTITEGFEDDVVWGATRFPLTEPSVLSQGIRWRTNHPNPPASNELTTGGGPAHTGLWGVYDPEHGYATGTPAECDIDNPPAHCLFKDGLSGTREGGGGALVGVGGYFTGSLQPNLVMILDGGAPIGLGMVQAGTAQFFGVIDSGGFTSFRVEETDGKVGQERYVFSDDYTLATATADAVPPRVEQVNSIDDTGDGVLAEGEATDAFITALLVDYSEPVRDLPGDSDPDDVTNPGNYLLIDDGGNGFQTVSCAGGVAAGDVEIAVDAVVYVSGSQPVAVVQVNGGMGLPEGSYRLLVCGTTSIRDWAGNPLDGNGDGTGGDDFVRNFSVIPPANNPPTAFPQSVTTPEDTPKPITLTGSDPDGDPLTYTIVTGPTHGALSGAPPNVTYTPAANYNGPDSFTFRVRDGSLNSPPATVTITVTAVNDPPVANPQSVTTPQDTPLAITLTGSDVDGDPLTFEIGTPPAHGSLTGTAPNVTYTPTTGYSGPDSFSFTVNDGTVTSAPATVTITVTEVSLPELTIGNASVTEGDTGPTSVEVTITLTPASSIPVSVQYATGGGTAIPGTDYTAASGTADFLIGATTATVPLEVLGDLLDEPEEGFGVTLSNPAGAVLGTPSTGTVTIFDNDPMADLSSADVVVDEAAGQAIVELNLSEASGFDVTVDFASADGTATSPADYGAVSGTAFIGAGALSTTVPIPVVDDPAIEGDETFTLELTSPDNAVLLTPSVTVTIRDDDGTAIFEDGFESGDFSHWSAAVP